MADSTEEIITTTKPAADPATGADHPPVHEENRPAPAAAVPRGASTPRAVPPSGGGTKNDPTMDLPDQVNHGLVIFTKPHCPFCTRVKLLTESIGAETQFIDATDGANTDLYNQVANATGHDTLPLVIANGRFIGGCDDTCIAVERGELQRCLNLHSLNAKIPENGERRVPASGGLFLFPPVTSRWAAQGVGIQVTIISIIIIVFREETWAHWVAFAMALDFLVRIIAGGSPSMLGSVTMPLVALLPEQLVPGPPKQFAAFCGLFFFTLATILFHAGEETDTSHIGGAVVVGMVMFAAFLEGFLNFCLGCWFFGLGNRFGIVPDTVYEPYTDTLGMWIYSINDQNRKKGWAPYDEIDAGAVAATNPKLADWRRRLGSNDQPVPEPVRVRQVTHPSGLHTAVDFDYKFPKTDDTIREHWGPKYTQPEDFGMALGLAGFAAALQATGTVMHVPFEAYQFVGLFAACIHGLLLICYLVKLVLARRKVYADFQHSFKRNAFAIIPITWLIFAYLLHPDHNATEGRRNLQEIMFWAGITVYSLHLIVSMACWVKNRANGEHINPSFLFPAAGALVVGLVAPLIAERRPYGYVECGYWYTGLGIFWFVVILAITFGHGLTYHWSDDRVRPLVAFWMAGAFLAQVAYQTVNRLPTFDTVCYIFFATGVFLFLVNVYLVYPGTWLLRGRFEMAYWAITFPLDVFVFSAVAYYRSTNHEFARGLVWLALIFAGWANFTMFWHTVALLVARKWPRAPQKWSPLSFNKLQHEAMRVMLAKLAQEAALPTPVDPAAAAAHRARLFEMWTEYNRLTVVHATYEDNILFEELRGFNAAQLHGAVEQHELIEAQLPRINTEFQVVSDQALVNAKTMILEHVNVMLDHVQWEEDHMQPMIRKNLNLAIHVDLIRQVWASVRREEMEFTVVAVVRHLPMHGQRVRFVKALTWALPERSQQIGAWLYRGLALDPLGDMKYQQLLYEVPEIAPRGTPGWSRVL